MFLVLKTSPPLPEQSKPGCITPGGHAFVLVFFGDEYNTPAISIHPFKRKSKDAVFCFVQSFYSAFLGTNRQHKAVVGN